MIYCIGNIDEGFCKIGYTMSIERKLSEARTSNPFHLEVLGIVEGTTREEHLLHKQFEKDRLSFEWFNLTDEIKRYFNIVKKEQCILHPITTHNQLLSLIGSITDVRIIYYLCNFLKYNNPTFTITTEIRKDICEKLFITPQTLSNSITRLNNIKLLLKDNKNITINPYFAWKGNIEGLNRYIEKNKKEILKFKD